MGFGRVVTFAGHRVQEINTTKGASNERIDRMASTGNPQHRVPANVGEDVTLAQLDQGKLGVVAVGEEVYGMSAPIRPRRGKASCLHVRTLEAVEAGA
jgi:hypothetical protein